MVLGMSLGMEKKLGYEVWVCEEKSLGMTLGYVEKSFGMVDATFFYSDARRAKGGQRVDRALNILETHK